MNVFLFNEIDHCKKSWKDTNNQQNVTVKAHGTAGRLYYTLWNKNCHFVFFSHEIKKTSGEVSSNEKISYQAGPNGKSSHRNSSEVTGKHKIQV